MTMTLLEGLRRSFPTFFMLAKPLRWIAQSPRRICVAVLVLLAMLAGPYLWWRAQLTTLPDIGEPFDVAAFKSTTIPDDRNAYVDYLEAWSLVKQWYPYSQSAVGRFDIRARWSKAIPELRQWAEDNRAALAVYRRGTERPDALGPVPQFEGFHSESGGMRNEIQFFQNLAFLEASRLEELGDMERAWGWYRAILRSIYHVGMRGTVERRSVAQTWHDELRDRVATWAASPRTTPALIRRAVDDVTACEALAPSESYTLKAEYLDVDRLLDDPEIQAAAFPRSWMSPIPSLGFTVTVGQAAALHDAWRSWLREPERSRRVMRLAIANWIAYYDLPPADRPKPDPKAAGFVDFFYQLGPESPANARAVPPRALASWLRSTFDANFLFGSWGWKVVRSTERSNHRALLVLLGQALYRRDYGTDSPTPEALVGPYLKSLPAELDDARDESIPLAGKPIKHDP
jgi:hypothetical protein